MQFVFTDCLSTKKIKLKDLFARGSFWFVRPCHLQWNLRHRPQVLSQVHLNLPKKNKMNRIQQSKLPPMVRVLFQKGNGNEQIGGTSCQRACISHKSTKHIAQQQKQMLQHSFTRQKLQAGQQVTSHFQASQIHQETKILTNCSFTDASDLFNVHNSFYICK